VRHKQDRTENAVESAGWPLSHCEALKEFVTKGMSYRDATDALNARFGTAYSRSAALGRARRMKLGEPERIDAPSIQPDVPVGRWRERPLSADGFRPMEFFRRPPVFVRAERAPFRCVGIIPRHLSLIELEQGDCRFPYGGDSDGEVITFCGHPRHKGSSYCMPHFHLAREPLVPDERPLSVAPLRLVRAI
jgi:GcrA cell cycle regulator